MLHLSVRVEKQPLINAESGCAQENGQSQCSDDRVRTGIIAAKAANNAEQR
jgi:hypothetical protein